MKKLSLFIGVLMSVISSLSAQIVVDAEMFKSNPSNFMGKVVTIKNVTFKSVVTNPGSPSGVVSSPSGNIGAPSPAPVGVAGPSSGKSQSMYCNPQPNMTLTKWSLGPENDVCVQVDARVKPTLDMIMVGKVAKSITFRVTPTMYMATRIEP